MFFTITLFAQKPNRGEIGIFGGGAYYLGDVNKIPFIKTKPSFGAFFRHSIDTRFNLTGSFVYAKISGSDAESKNAYYISRNKSFSHSIYELSSKLEFNFIPFIAGDKKTKYTPYTFAGLAFSYTTNAYTNYLFSIPFGIGYKYNLTEDFIIGAEYSMRKTFTDKLDFPEEPYIPGSKQQNYAANSDWYSIFGIYLAYKIKYRMKCPAFD
ncbi:MAG: hypothetical protein JEZ09_03825 [Salinivirgaceae bacterium]|nr:hypothetical protein [Salinivirgaceae bacterium]